MGRKLTGGFRSSQIGESCLAQLTRSRKKRDAALDAIKAACEAHINGPLFKELADIIEATAGRTGMSAEGFHVMPHRDDSQTLMVHYPTATPVDGYIDKVVKIESGAKSALDPNSVRSVRPYVADDRLLGRPTLSSTQISRSC